MEFIKELIKVIPWHYALIASISGTISVAICISFIRDIRKEEKHYEK